MDSCQHKTTSTKTENRIQIIKCEDCKKELHAFTAESPLDLVEKKFNEYADEIVETLKTLVLFKERQQDRITTLQFAKSNLKRIIKEVKAESVNEYKI